MHTRRVARLPRHAPPAMDAVVVETSPAGWPRPDLAVAVLDSSSALVMVIGRDGRPVLVNDALTRTTGWTEAELLTAPIWDTLVAPEDVLNAQAFVSRAFVDGGADPQEADWLDRFGRRRRIAMQNDVLRDDSGVPLGIVTVGVDVTERRLEEASLRRRAESDPLTGLLNRAALFDALEARARDKSGGSFGILFGDLDGFKDANDQHGHHVGDLVLSEVAQRLRGAVGDQDQVARFGGDEFVILCPDGNPSRLAALAARVENVVERPIATPHGYLRLGISIGTSIGEPGATVDEVMHAADKAMYAVKLARQRSRRSR